MAQLPDSGERRAFSTGSVRDKVDGKGAYHLMSPFPILQYALRMEDGMSKYGERNWEKGQPVMQFFNSGVRHCFNFLEDCLLGREPKEDHLGAALWNIGGIIHTLKMIDAGLLPKELDDHPFPERVLGKKEPTVEDYGRTVSIPEQDCFNCKHKYVCITEEPCWQCDSSNDKWEPEEEEEPEKRGAQSIPELLRHVWENHPELIKRDCTTCKFAYDNGAMCNRRLGSCRSDDLELWVYRYAEL